MDENTKYCDSVWAKLDDDNKIRYQAWKWTEQTGWQWVELEKDEISKLALEEVKGELDK